jgi:hypothetical protein
MVTHKRSVLAATVFLLMATCAGDSFKKGLAHQEQEPSMEEASASDQSVGDLTETERSRAPEKTEAQIVTDLEREAQRFFQEDRELEGQILADLEAQTQRWDYGDPKMWEQPELKALQQWRSDELQTRAMRITGETDVRSAIERLIRCVDRTERMSSRVRHTLTSQWRLAQEFVAMAALSVSLENAVVERIGSWVRTDLRRPFRGGKLKWNGIVLAAIESYRDERAREFLLEYALRRDEFDSMAHWALVFLRGFDPEAVKPRIQAALREEVGDGLVGEEPPRRSSKPYSQGYEFYRNNRAFYLQACLRSLEYAESLPPEEREAYQYFERSRWWSHAFRRRGTMLFSYGLPDWREGNERFVLAILQMTPSGEYDAYGMGLPEIPLEGLLWLKQQAESGNWPEGDWADDLKKSLEAMIDARRESDRQTRSEMGSGLDSEPK